MKQVVRIRASRTVVGPWEYEYDAEAQVLDEDTGKSVYVYVCLGIEENNFTVSLSSMYDIVTDECGSENDPLKVEVPEYTEAYYSLEDARVSEYYDVFVVLEQAAAQIKKKI